MNRDEHGLTRTNTDLEKLSVFVCAGPRSSVRVQPASPIYAHVYTVGMWNITDRKTDICARVTVLCGQ
jgi:hypothetical protein